MKILRIVSAGYEQGGAENGIVLTNRVLRAKGHDVRVLSSDVNPEKKHFSDYEFKSVIPHGLQKLTSAAFNRDAYRVTKQVLNDFRPDVVLLHTLSQPTASVLFPLKKYPTILFVHGPELYTKALLPWYLKRDDYRNGRFEVADLTLRGRLHYYYFLYICRTVYKLAFPHVDKVVALSSYTLKILNAEGISATIIPNGVGLLKAFPLSLEPPSLLYAGRLEKFKGIDDLIDALPAILSAYPALRLRIAGEGSYGATLKNQATKLGLQSAVEFLGHLNSRQLEQAYRECSFFVLPSTWPETFGKVGVEAMSVGRPVIATDVGGVKDWLKDGYNGYLVKPHHPDQLSDKILSLLRDPKRAITMATAAQASAQTFSITAMANNIELAIQTIIPVSSRS